MSQDDGKKLVKLTIDGQEVSAPSGATVLEAAKAAGIDIPALCYHPVLGGAGACRVCIVEVVARGRRRMVTSCVYPAREGLEVYTNTEKVLKARRGVISFLLAKAPAAKVVQELAAEYGVSEPAYEPTDPDGRCILCGQCVRTCTELIKAGAISLVRRGQERKVGTPYDAESEACVGCGACKNLCPTGHVRMRDRAKTRSMLTWHTELPLSECSRCGEPYLPTRLVDFLKKNSTMGPELLEVCPDCRSKGTAKNLTRGQALAGRDGGR